MGEPHIRDFSRPDDEFRGDGIWSRRITLGVNTTALNIHEPGWRWSTHARAIGGELWCPTHHAGYALAGSLHVVLADGTEFDVAPRSLFDIPPGHDAWVTSAVPYETIDWIGARSWLADQSSSTGILATILFSDVVESSLEVRQRGNRQWSDVNAALFENCREIVIAYGGEVVKSTGDGLLAVFNGPSRALRCGTDMASAAPHLGVSVRIGIHTGEVERVDGDVHGLAVHEAARIMAAAAPGEILVSETTRMLTVGVAFDDRGEHELKGIGVRRLFAMRSRPGSDPNGA